MLSSDSYIVFYSPWKIPGKHWDTLGNTGIWGNFALGNGQNALGFPGLSTLSDGGHPVQQPLMSEMKEHLLIKGPV